MEFSRQNLGNIINISKKEGQAQLCAEFLCHYTNDNYVSALDEWLRLITQKKTCNNGMPTYLQISQEYIDILQADLTNYYTKVIVDSPIQDVVNQIHILFMRNVLAISYKTICRDLKLTYHKVKK
jgi:hypothetical protein